MNIEGDPLVRYDVWIYLAAAPVLCVLAPFRSRWRMLVGGLLGCGLGSYLLVDLNLVTPKPFIVGLGFVGLTVALGAFVYVRRGPRFERWFGKQPRQGTVRQSTRFSLAESLQKRTTDGHR